MSEEIKRDKNGRDISDNNKPWNKVLPGRTHSDLELMATVIYQHVIRTPKAILYVDDIAYMFKRSRNAIGIEMIRQFMAIHYKVFQSELDKNKKLDHYDRRRNLFSILGWEIPKRPITVSRGTSKGDRTQQSDNPGNKMGNTGIVFDAGLPNVELAPIFKSLTIAEKITQLYYCDTLRDLPDTRHKPIIGMYEDYVRKGGKYKHINLSWRQINMANDIHNELIIR